MIKIGDELTVAHDIIGISGAVHISKGQKVKVRKIDKREGFWGKISGDWYPEEILFIGLDGLEGVVFLPTVFKEIKQISYED